MPAHLFDLTDRVAIMTGGATGLGLGMAKALIDMGCTVEIWGRRPKVVEEAAEKIGASFQICDVADKSAVDAAFANSLAKHKVVHGMFANAGIADPRATSLDRDEDAWRRVLAVNVEGVAYCFRAAAVHMRERAKNGDPFGRLVGTSSVASIMGAAYNEHYGASKGAVNSMVRALAVEYGRYGVTVNAILPGFARSEMTEDIFEDEKMMAAVLPRVPMRRLGEPEDYGGIAAYLMSDVAGYHTGQCFTIDGGYSIF